VAQLATAYRYAARDQAAAESMADAMAAFGYAEVGARPSHRRHLLEKGMGWEVVVIDDIPYPPGNIANELLDPATLAQAILADKVVQLLG
jgi:hypothetical protein